MGDETKKISFGFSKLAKKTVIVSNRLNQIKPEDNKVEFIDCLEGNSIKLKDPYETQEEKPLVIPLKEKLKDVYSAKTNIDSNVTEPSQLSGFVDHKPLTSDLVTAEENTVLKLSSINEAPGPNSQSDNLTLDEIAEKEILEELQKKKTADETRIFSVPLTSNAPSGEKESTLEDYESIPVGDFGMAMLRGMGWAPGKGIGKNEKLVTPSLPTLRPKGMGLGADKVIKVESGISGGNEDLKMIKGSFVRVIAGTHKDSYGQIEGFDDESGRLIVKLVLKNVSVSLNEFMVQLVDKTEFTKNAKVINVGKYEQYKDDEGRKVKNNPNDEETFKEVKLPKEHAKYEEQCETYKNKPDSNKSTKHNQATSSSESEILDNNKATDIKQKSLSSRNDEGKSYLGSTSGSRSSANNQEKNRKLTSLSKSSVSYSKTSTISTSKEEKISSSKERSTSKKNHRHGSTPSDGSSDYSRKNKNRTRKKKPSSHKHRSRSRSSSSDGFSSSSDYSKKDKHRTRRKKPSSHKHRSRSRSSSSDGSSSSSDYSRKDKHRTRRKKPSSHKHRSRSRSQSPRKHNSHKKHKKTKYN